jgi:hypothetical protein
LSAIYHVPFSDLLVLFGVDLGQVGVHQLEVKPQRTYLMAAEIDDPDREIALPIRFDQGVDLDGTSLLSRIVAQWGDVPYSAIQHLHLRDNNYGVIGKQDFTIYPLLRPGSFVQIDPRLRKIRSSRWRTEFAGFARYRKQIKRKILSIHSSMIPYRSTAVSVPWPLLRLGGRLCIDFLSLHPADLDAGTKSQRQVARGDPPVLSTHFVKFIKLDLLDANVRDRSC